MCEGMPGDGGLSRGSIGQMDDAEAHYMLDGLVEGRMQTEWADVE